MLVRAGDAVRQAGAAGVPVRGGVPGALLPRGRLPPRVLHVHLRLGTQRRHAALRTRVRAQRQDHRARRHVVHMTYRIIPGPQGPDSAI